MTTREITQHAAKVTFLYQAVRYETLKDQFFALTASRDHGHNNGSGGGRTLHQQRRQHTQHHASNGVAEQHRVAQSFTCLFA